MRLITFEPTFEGWQSKARQALGNAWEPQSIQWQESGSEQANLDMFDIPALRAIEVVRVRVPKKFIESAKMVARHSDPTKWALLYRVLWRLGNGEPKLLDNPADADALQSAHFEKEVRKDAYRMTAFVRFREVKMSDGVWYVAWYEPAHDSVDLNSDFFVKRFANMRWSILTPVRCMHWNGEQLSITEGVDKSQAPTFDKVEPLWVSYYSNIFNPARIKVRAMQAQLLKRNWKNLPEAAVIEPLIRSASIRVGGMLEHSEFQRVRETDYSLVRPPRGVDLSTLRDAASKCRGCPLWKNASCTVFGEGSRDARVLFVGEQPGDQEDRTGKPFVGPSGQVFDRALAELGIDRAATYVTNSVKHFKFEPAGKRRIHKTASPREIAACRPWLEAEIELINPQLIVAMGTTATRALFNVALKVTEHRGTVLQSPFKIPTLITVHPSSLLRLPEGVDPEEQFRRFVDDLSRIKTALAVSQSV
jgi:probable DNA metabolism protein